MDIDCYKWVEWRTFIHCVRGIIEWCMPCETTILKVDLIMAHILDEIGKREVENGSINKEQTLDSILYICHKNERFFIKMPNREELGRYYPTGRREHLERTKSGRKRQRLNKNA